MFVFVNVFRNGIGLMVYFMDLKVRSYWFQFQVNIKVGDWVETSQHFILAKFEQLTAVKWSVIRFVALPETLAFIS